MRKSRAYDISVRFQALKLYLEGLGFRSIGRILNVSNVTVLKWIRSMGEKIFQEGAVWKNTKIRAVSRIQIDELWHYVQKNSIEFGFGLLYASKQVAIFCGNRTKQSAKLIWKLIKELRPEYIFTDNLSSYRGVFPKNKHVIGKNIHNLSKA
ncbi:MAG: hypothetical protein KTV77_04795 [Wolbachia endosymbiont of Fragariocoptes setiger]|nr:hypothetical protein [Wolbachia endosymbiont of Fragariocoptes setiger]